MLTAGDIMDAVEQLPGCFFPWLAVFVNFQQQKW